MNQCIRIDQLEKNSKTLEELENEFDRLGKEISSKNKKVRELEDKIAQTQKKADVVREYSVEEKSVREYIDARAQLSSVGFPIDDLPNVKVCLFAMKNENFGAEQIVEKLNSITNLEVRKNSLESELSAFERRPPGEGALGTAGELYLLLDELGRESLRFGPRDESNSTLVNP